MYKIINLPKYFLFMLTAAILFQSLPFQPLQLPGRA